MFIPTLKNITVAKFAIALYNDAEIFNLESSYDSFLYNLPEEIWEHLIKQKLPLSDYPIPILNEIIAVIRPISFEKAQWNYAHQNLLWEVPNKVKICWKSDGTIDQLKTADLLIRSPQVLTFETRFVLACQYWSWEAVLELWKNIPDYEKNRISKKYEGEVPITTKCEQNVSQWFKLLRHRKNIDSSSCTVWSIVLIQGNVTMWNRVFDHSSPSYKQNILKRLFFCCKNIPIVRYCLSRMNVEEKTDMLNKYPYQVLRVYLHWPLQPLFIGSASKAMVNLSKDSFLCLIHIMICQKILPNWRDSNYVDLLKTFWRESPNHCKNYVTRYAIFGILKAILDGQRFHSLRCTDAFRPYLFHDETVFENAEQCAFITDAHQGD